MLFTEPQLITFHMKYISLMTVPLTHSCHSRTRTLFTVSLKIKKKEERDDKFRCNVTHVVT